MDGQQESSENNNPPRARENNKGIDRRTFLKRSAIAGGLFASFLSGDAVLKRIAEGKDVLNDDDSSQIEDLSNEKSSISSEMLDEEQREVNQIAERLGVNLVGIREAYRLKGVPFDEKNAKEFGANLPLKWDVERARLLEELFYQLPEYFREPDGDGEPLTISLTDFGTDCECAGTYVQNAPKNVMLLDLNNFNTDKREYAMSLLTHEGIHRLQELKYSKLDPLIQNTFDMNMEEFCKFTDEWLTENPYVENFSESAIHGALRYGVKDPVQSVLRTNHVELEASLGEIYLRGEQQFIDTLSKIYGDKANDLYTYMRDSIFAGKEYDADFLSNQQEIQQDAEDNLQVVEGAGIYNEALQRVFTEEGRAEFQPLPSDEELLLQTEEINKSLNIDVVTVPHKSYGDIQHTEVRFQQDPESNFIYFDQERNTKGEILNEAYEVRVDENGDIAKTNDIERDFPPNALRTIINKLFVLPDDLKSSWWEARDPRDQTIFQGEATHNDDVYTFKLAADGLLVYKKHKKDYTPIA